MPQDRKRFYHDMESAHDEARTGLYDKERVKALISTPGYFASMLPIGGAVEAVKQLDALPGVTVRICSSAIASAFFFRLTV